METSGASMGDDGKADGDQKGMVRVKQAAALLGVSPRTVWRMLADGQLKKICVRGCTCLVLADVVNFGKITTK
jgi:excisionase family DNA binding protein